MLASYPSLAMHDGSSTSWKALLVAGVENLADFVCEFVAVVYWNH